MRRKIFYAGLGLVSAAVFLTAAVNSSAAGGSDGPRSKLTIVAPAAPGGGWDGFAREGQQGLRATGIVGSVQVVNIPGAAGTIGLSQVAGMDGREDILLVTGGVMVGGIIINDSAVTLEDMVPIARLADDYNVLVVPADSPFKTLDDFMAALKENPGGTAIAGGSLGAIDHIMAGMLTAEAGVSPRDMNYIAYPGGGEVVSSMLSHTAKAGLSGYNEFRDQIEAGNIRALALSAAKPVDDIPVPTFTEQGVDVAMSNWRGYVAPAGISDEVRAELIAIVSELRESDSWQDTLKRNNWVDSYLTGDDFGAFIVEETRRTAEVVKEIGL
ncbi:tripartite tricarboxylate transporter substrate binding protein [Leucobacter insecticola]|uniref:Tripartite tricarboxylate transporter substrate binding protein n=1 Tax=Leucobacter insecticola TaxID=2714934 RepID=A0A6G8FG56_9MICO|nr:tripartite tricarboxylate transporter substrate-binding protein [Leucobacter insecticola]QIM15430.1 tripartite tricarboxylate transporter substrate binding protein [Leucobacter insecticola]